MQSYTENEHLADIKLLAVDMDLTLLHTDKTQPEGMPQLIADLADAGVVFCPASGRPASTLQDMFPESAGTSAFCGDNGGNVIYAGKTVFKDKMDPELWRALCRDAASRPGAVPVLCCYDSAALLMRDKGQSEEVEQYYRDIYYFNDFDSCNMESNKFSILYPGFDAEPAFAEHWGPAYGDKLNVTNAGREWVDFMNPGISKGAGLEKLAEHMGLKMSEVAAVGDTYNDISMLEAAGHSFIVANAEDHMAQHADWQIPSNDDDGIVQLARAIIAAKQA